ncbi:MAG: carboxypeptidase-like regulatory domain-containing protein, partial [Bacteroidota bacterium]
MRLAFLAVFLTVLCTCVRAQETITLNLSTTGITRSEALQRMNDGLPIRIFYQEDQLNDQPIALDLKDATVRQALDAILENTALDFVDYRNRVYVIGPALTIGTEFDAAYYAAVAARIEASDSEGVDARGQAGPAYIGQLESLRADGMARVNGTISDGNGGETIIGATVQIENSTTATVTDENGNYELTLRPGQYTLVVSYVGFGANRYDVRVNGSGTYNIVLNSSATNLEEIVVTEEAADANVGRVQAGVQRIDMAQLEKLPTFMGETDVVKALLLNPGVSSIGEGASGFNVRGGEIDQNLLLMDNGALINSSHALGFFSTYNADLIKSVDLYKANMPARFGGRLASVLDVQLRDGN